MTLTSGGLQRFSTAAYDDFVGVQNAAVINLSFSGTSVGITMKEVYRESTKSRREEDGWVRLGHKTTIVD